MTLEEIITKVKGRIEVGVVGTTATCVYCGDLLSDIMGHAGENCALVTIQNHLNTIAVCTLVGCQIIVLCHNRPVPPDMAEAAKREGVAIIVTAMSQYAAALALSELPPADKCSSTSTSPRASRPARTSR